MAITLDSNGSASASGAGSLSYSGTSTAGANKLAVVQVTCFGANRAVGTVLCNGSAMTKASQGDGNNVNTSIWYQINPAVGTFNIIVKNPGNASIRSAFSSLFGAAQTNQPNGTLGTTWSKTTSEIGTITTNVSNCWLFDAVGDQSAAMTAQAGQTTDINFDTSTSMGGYKSDVSIGDNTMRWNFTGAETGRHDIASFAPFVAPGGTITLDSNGSASGGASGTLSFLGTSTAGSNKLAVVQVVCFGSNRTTGTVTYNGVSLTKSQQGDGNNINASLWYMINPPVGTFNVVVVNPPSASIRAAFSSLFGCDQTTQPDATFGTSWLKGLTQLGTISTVTNSCWLFDAIGDQTGAMTAGANQTTDIDFDSSTSKGSYKQNVDLGNITMSYTFLGTAENGRHEIMAVRPASGAIAFLPHLMLMGAG